MTGIVTRLNIALDAIDVIDRVRPVDPAHARVIADNFAQAGQQSDITVRGNGPGRWRLVAGLHRLEAARLLNWPTISAQVIEADDNEARLRELDENLVRHDLNALDRAAFLAERQAVFVAIQGERRGGDRKSKRYLKKIEADTFATLDFRPETAERAGMSKRTIRAARALLKALSTDIRARLAGTVYARNQSELKALAAVPPDQQHAVLDLAIERGIPIRAAGRELGVFGGQKAVADPAQGSPKFTALMEAWTRADKPARRRFLAHLKGQGLLDEVAA